MSERDNDAIAEAGRIASEMLERSLMKAVGVVEAELARVVRAGEADIARLAGSIVEILAKISAAQSVELWLQLILADVPGARWARQYDRRRHRGSSRRCVADRPRSVRPSRPVWL